MDFKKKVERELLLQMIHYHIKIEELSKEIKHKRNERSLYLYYDYINKLNAIQTLSLKIGLEKLINESYIKKDEFI